MALFIPEIHVYTVSMSTLSAALVKTTLDLTWQFIPADHESPSLLRRSALQRCWIRDKFRFTLSIGEKRIYTVEIQHPNTDRLLIVEFGEKNNTFDYGPWDRALIKVLDDLKLEATTALRTMESIDVAAKRAADEKKQARRKQFADLFASNT